MSLSAAIVWEVRSTATAANANGGGFKTGASGVDYSQQDSAQYNLTGMTSSGTNATILTTSASADMIGNLIHIISGTNATPGWYEITGAVVGVSLTVDRNWCSGIVSSGVGNIGGALSMNSTTSNQTDANFAAAVVAGNTVWFKDSVSIGQATTFTDGSAPNWVKLWGYKTTRGDNPTGDNRPTITCSTFLLTTSAKGDLQNLVITGTAANVNTIGSGSVAKNCKWVNTSTTASRNAANSGQNVNFINCEFISYRGVACNANAGSEYFLGCLFHNSVTGLTGAAGSNIMYCIFKDNTTTAAFVNQTAQTINLIAHNTFYGSETQMGTGLSIGSSNGGVRLYNNIFYGFTTAISDAGGAGINIGDFNNFYNNGTNYSGFTAGSNDKTLDPTFASIQQIARSGASTSSNTLTDAGADFSNVVVGRDFVYIISGSGVTTGIYPVTSKTTTTLVSSGFTMGTGSSVVYQITTGDDFRVGSNMQAVAYPSGWQNNPTVAYTDIGAVQRKERANTDPGIANVLNGVDYMINDVSKTGNYVEVADSNVKAGTTFGSLSANTGTYDGSDRWTDPGATNVRNGTAYKANSTSNNRTGSLVVPADTDVKVGTSFDNSSTGTYDGSDRWTDPGEANVRDGTTYKANSVSENKEGSLDLPAVTDVKIDVDYDGATKTGTYDGSDRWTDPLSINVKEGVEYKANATINNRVGSFIATPLPQKIDHNLGVNPTTRMLSGALYIIRDNNVITEDLGEASYELLNPDGAPIVGGIGEGELEADENGFYFITPVDLTALDQWPNYMLVITIEARSVEYSQPFKFAIEQQFTGGEGGGDCPTAEEIADAVLDANVSDHTGEGTIGGFISLIDDIPQNPLLTNDGRLDNLDAAVSTRLPTSSYTAPTTPPTPSEIADAVWDETLGDHLGTGSTGEALANGVSDSGAIAGAVWDTLAADHNGVGSFGEILNEAGTGDGPTASSIAAAVWDRDLEDSDTSGTFGGLMQKLLTVAKFIGLK